MCKDVNDMHPPGKFSVELVEGVFEVTVHFVCLLSGRFGGPAVDGGRIVPRVQETSNFAVIAPMYISFRRCLSEEFHRLG